MGLCCFYCDFHVGGYGDLDGKSMKKVDIFFNYSVYIVSYYVTAKKKTAREIKPIMK